VDIVGAALRSNCSGKPRVLAAPVAGGHRLGGFARTERFPVPAPATLAISAPRGIGVTQCNEPHELVHLPAALLAEFVEEFGADAKSGRGKKKWFRTPARATTKRGPMCSGRCWASVEFSLQAASRARQAKLGLQKRWETDRVAVLETNLDDVSGKFLGHFV